MHFEDNINEEWDSVYYKDLIPKMYSNRILNIIDQSTFKFP